MASPSRGTKRPSHLEEDSVSKKIQANLNSRLYGIPQHSLPLIIPAPPPSRPARITGFSTPVQPTLATTPEDLLQAPLTALDQALSQEPGPQKITQQKKTLSGVERPPVTRTWQVFGDSKSTTYLKSSTTLDEYEIACRYFHARLALVARGFSTDELLQIFNSCLPSFLQDGDDYERKLAYQAFEREYDLVEDKLVEKIQAYANAWLNSEGGSYYREQYTLHR